jgi:hypothetical protein
MSQINQAHPTPKANPVELTAAVNHLVRKLPSGTAYGFINFNNFRTRVFLDWRFQC